MSRVLLFVAIFVIVFLLLKYYRKQKIKGGDAEKKAATTAESKQTEDMVRCVQCGVHLPKGESLVTGGASEPKYFCSEAHRRAYSNQAQ
ncbi:MAG: PP0621 family protein [Candidatus Nitrotoga sp.]